MPFIAFSNSSTWSSTADLAKGKLQCFSAASSRLCPYQIRTVSADNGLISTKYASTTSDVMQHPIDRVCDENGINQRLTKPHRPWTDDQAERIDYIAEGTTTKTFHCEAAEVPRAHVLAFITAYKFDEHLKILKRKTPFQAICGVWTANSAVFKIDPHHLVPGRYT